MNKKQIYSNYKRNNKFLGIMDYKSLTFLVIYLIIIWNMLNLFDIQLEYIIYLFISLSVPVVSILCINKNEESAIDILIIIIKYMLSRKIYIFNNNLVEEIKYENIYIRR